MADGSIFSGGLGPDDLIRFQEIIWDFYRTSRRSMPWRDNTDPYWVLVSEIMLQQTQVSRVMVKFDPFVRRFPTVHSLAEASLADVLRLWSGLGYNRRARFLHQSAGVIVRDFAGVVPAEPSVLGTLPGIGPATAGSVAAFAYNRPVVFIETNIRRVFLTAFFSQDDRGVGDRPVDDRAVHDRTVHDRELLPLIEQTLPHDNPREWYWALMDVGVHLAKTAGNANRRSAHYTRQSPFEKSRRQLRGRILQVLTDRGTIAAEELPAYTGFGADEVTEVLAILEAEGFIDRGDNAGVGDRLQIRDG